MGWSDGIIVVSVFGRVGWSDDVIVVASVFGRVGYSDDVIVVSVFGRVG